MERLAAIRLSLVFSLFYLLCFQSSGYTGSPTGARRRFEYKLSFKGPHLIQRDGTIPFWEHIGHAIASEESVRITPSLKSKKGAVWSKEISSHEHWEVEVVFRVSGRGRIGADGLSIWYTETRAIEGPVFGSKDHWNGLGVILDSFDNDNLRNNPWVMAMVNDGTKSYQHDTDGGNQQLGGCQRDFRNKPFPVRVKIEYFKKALTVLINNGLNNDKDAYELCMRAEGVELPAKGYFGVSAATGDLAVNINDDHDVLAFITHSLSPILDTPQVPHEVPDQERKKFEQEFDEYQQKLQKAKDAYKKEHPTKPGVIDEDDDRMYDPTELRELRMIFDGQNAMHHLIRTMLVKLDEVIGRQEREISMLTMIHQQSGLPTHQQPPGQQQQQLPHTSSIQRHEVDSMLNSHRELSTSVRDVRILLNDVQTRVANLNSGGSGAQNPWEVGQTLTDLKSHLSNLEGDMKTLISRPAASSNCPQVAPVNCVSTFSLFVFLVAQLVCIIGYMIYRSSKEAAAKKFY